MYPISLTLTLLLTLGTAALSGGPSIAGADPDTPRVQMTIDSARRTVLLVAGPFTIPAGTPAAVAEAHGNGGAHVHGPDAPFLTFEWPTDGWLRGVSLRVRDSGGQELPRRLVHHVNVVNLGRRQLLYPAPERTIAIGQETEDIRLPATVGIPIHAGAEMGLLMAWHNTSADTWAGVTVELEVEWLPSNTAPRPLDVLPVYMDVRYPIGQRVDFDLPAGPQQFTADFTMPISGRIIGAGGHLHDYGTGLALAEVRDGDLRDVISLRTRLDAEGRLIAVDRKLPGVRGDGIKLQKGRSYRMTGSYNNPTGQTLEKGAMVHLILLFAPDRSADWPDVDRDEPDFVRDLTTLQQRGRMAQGRHVH
jgi:hypothetical protein